MSKELARITVQANKVGTQYIVGQQAMNQIRFKALEFGKDTRWDYDYTTAKYWPGHPIAIEVVFY